MFSRMTNSRLIVITGPSGVGKGCLVSELLRRNNHLWLSVSATTRAPRRGEVDGEHYFFLDREKFSELVKADGFLEWAEFAGNCYGTPREQVNQKLRSGVSVLLEIELEGARQVRKNFPDAFKIFISPPSFEELERRIRGRATDSEEAIQRRLFRAKDEINAQNEFDSVIVNQDLSKAVLELEQKIGLSNSTLND